MKTFTDADVVALLVAKAAGSTAAALAIEMGISPQYLNDLTKGRRPPSDSVLSFLNLERVIREKAKPNGKVQKHR